MSRSQAPVPSGFPSFLKEVKARIQQAQTRAVLFANAQRVRLYWDIGRMIDERQQQQGWGAAVIPRLARELRNELPEIKGFSERNIDRMAAFYRAYPAPSDFSLPPVAKLPSPAKVPQAVAQIAAADQSIFAAVPWGYHAWLMDKVDAEYSYMDRNAVNGWSRRRSVRRFSP
jgi:hypothetical protein